jgi:hypothetical protein
VKAAIVIELRLPDTPLGQDVFARIARTVTKAARGFIEVERIHLAIEPEAIEILKMFPERSIGRIPWK